ncbi:hypothetical protein [Streptomyces sp. NPDC006551]|uniref:hypothetical protein n=1 Tax=Streptomyces sp. NPDC006551 TaxID=3157178 RepID=UPI0033B58ABD
MLLFAATGHYPYEGPTWQAVALKIEDLATPPDLTDAPPELVPLITEMLALDPDARPALPEVTERLVRVIREQGLTALQAKRRLSVATSRSTNTSRCRIRPPLPHGSSLMREGTLVHHDRHGSDHPTRRRSPLDRNHAPAR